MDTAGELTPMDTLAAGFYAGPSNYLEWFYPWRLTLDLEAVADLAVTGPGDWRYDEEGLLVTRAAEVDAPVLAVAPTRGTYNDAAAWELFRTRLAPTARNGASRDQEAGFRVLQLEGWYHGDVELAEDATLAQAIADFVQANRSGSVDLSGLP